MSVVVEPSAREAFTPRELTRTSKNVGHDTWTTRAVSRPQPSSSASVSSSFTRRLRGRGDPYSPNLLEKGFLRSSRGLYPPFA
jgi:hypothetical protein